jgi:hypothetical protein
MNRTEAVMAMTFLHSGGDLRRKDVTAVRVDGPEDALILTDRAGYRLHGNQATRVRKLATGGPSSSGSAAGNR